MGDFGNYSGGGKGEEVCRLGDWSGRVGFWAVSQGIDLDGYQGGWGRDIGDWMRYGWIA